MIRVAAIHQIEMTSRCNLRCKYCPSPHLARPKLDMSDLHYFAALRWARWFHVNRGQQSLNLAGIGESTLHPEFVRNVHLAREVVGETIELVLATNGLLMTEDLARAIAPAKPRVFVSLHRPERAGSAVEALRAAGILAGVSVDPSVAATDWAGQVKWHVSATPRRLCPWVRGGWVVVLADGRVSRCSFDASGVGVLTREGRAFTIDEGFEQDETSPYALCRTCDQDVGVPLPAEVTHAVA